MPRHHNKDSAPDRCTLRPAIYSMISAHGRVRSPTHYRRRESLLWMAGIHLKSGLPSSSANGRPNGRPMTGSAVMNQYSVSKMFFRTTGCPAFAGMTPSLKSARLQDLDLQRALDGLYAINSIDVAGTHVAVIPNAMPHSWPDATSFTSSLKRFSVDSFAFVHHDVVADQPDIGAAFHVPSVSGNLRPCRPWNV